MARRTAARNCVTIVLMQQQSVAIVTGAGRGIGRAVALELARLQYRLALVARTEDELDKTARLAQIDDALIVPADVSDAQQAGEVVHRAVTQFGRIDVLVHCAGVAPLLSVEQTTPAIWREVIDTNLSSAYYFAHALWPVFTRQRGGVIVLVSSESSRDPFKGFSAYGAAKAGLNLLGKALAKEGAKLGVRVHIVAPGAVETGMFRKLITPQQFPREKALEPVDVARTIAQCIRGDLAYSSGEVIFLHKTLE